MSRREELERELEVTQERIDNLPEDTPKEVRDAYRTEYDSISFELNNLFDDYETQSE